MSAGVADRILSSTLTALADYQDMLSTAARLEDDPQAARQALQAAQALMDARQALLAVTMPQAPQGPPTAPQTPARPIEDYASKGPVTWEQVHDCMTVGEWVTAEDVAALIDWKATRETHNGKRDDVARRLNYLVAKGLADRQPPLRYGRKAKNVKWRRLA